MSATEMTTATLPPCSYAYHDAAATQQVAKVREELLVDEARRCTECIIIVKWLLVATVFDIAGITLP